MDWVQVLVSPFGSGMQVVIRARYSAWTRVTSILPTDYVS